MTGFSTRINLRQLKGIAREQQTGLQARPEYNAS